MIVKIDQDLYEFKDGGAGCLIGPPLITWGMMRILHVPVLGLHFMASTTWVDWLILILGIASFWLPGRKFLTIDRKQRVVTVHQGSLFDPTTEKIPFDRIERLEAMGLRRYATDKTQDTAMYMQLRDGREIPIKRGRMGYESAVRTAWDIEKVIGIYGDSEPDEDGVTGDTESAKMLKTLDDAYKIRKVFTRRRGSK